MSRIWFSGSRNPNKVTLSMSGHHVTLERLYGQGHIKGYSKDFFQLHKSIKKIETQF